MTETVPAPSAYQNVRCGLKLGGVVPKWQASTYINYGALPDPPAYWSPTFKGYWGMLGNNSVSDCVQTGAAHIVKEWAATLGKAVPFTSESCIQTYAESAGYNGTWFSDQGTDIAAFSEFWRTTGILDSDGGRHKIDAYAVFDARDLVLLRKLVREFRAVGLGYQLAADSERQYLSGVPWSETAGIGNGDGHFVPCVGWNSRGNLLVVTWPTKQGETQAVTPMFHVKRCAIGIVYFSLEQLDAAGLSADQLDGTKLRADIAALNRR